MIDITINGIKRQVKPGLTIMQACELNNITIPHFCYHDKLSISGNCRMCLVEVIENPNNPLVKRVASCARNVSPNMDIYTNTAMVKKAREGVLEFLLANHPLDCPICDQGGECDLQDQSLIFGGDRGRFYEVKRSVEDKNCGPLVKTLMTRCIHCTRCVRFSSEVAGVPIMGVTGRGSQMEIGFYIEKMLNSEISGNVIDLCPVGALTSKPYAFTARSWELRSFNSIDLFDSFGSNIRVDVRGSNIMRILPKINDSLNEDWISDKIRFVYDGLKAQRLLSPYIKVKNTLVKSSWQKAFNSIRSYIFNSISNGPLNIQGIAGNFVDAESLISFKDLLNKLGSSNIDVNSDNSKFKNDIRGDYIFNTNINNIKDSDVCLLIATNPRLEAPILNIKLRQLFLNDVSIYNLGFNSNLNYYTKSLGNNVNTLVKIIEGNHWFCQKLLNCKSPLVIVGSSFFQREDNLSSLLPYLNKLLSRSNSKVNVLPAFGNTITGLDLNIVPGYHSQNSNLSKNSLYYFLGADDIYKTLNYSNNNLFIYQGHHGDQTVKFADIILPSVTYFEKDATFSSLEGFTKQVKAVFFSLGRARNDWKIIRALSDVLNVSLNYSTKEELNIRLYNIAPFFNINYGINKKSWFNSSYFEKLNFFSNTPFSSFVNNFYLNDSISRTSKTMSLCSTSYSSKFKSF